MIISKDQCIILSAPQSPLLPPPPSGLHASPEAPFVKELVSRLKQAADGYVSACAVTMAAWEDPVTDCMYFAAACWQVLYFRLALHHRLDGRDVMQSDLHTEGESQSHTACTGLWACAADQHEEAPFSWD